MMPDTFRPEPRCHVCRTEPVRMQVNAMLAGGSSDAQIVRAVPEDGTDEVSLDSVRNHANRHFPVQNVAKATYREILERRAAQNQIDFVNGLATAITPLAYLETVMVKGFQNLVRDDTEVTIEMGLKAAEKLHAAIGPEDTGAKTLQMRLQMYRIIDVVQPRCPSPCGLRSSPGLMSLARAGLMSLGRKRLSLRNFAMPMRRSGCLIPVTTATTTSDRFAVCLASSVPEQWPVWGASSDLRGTYSNLLSPRTSTCRTSAQLRRHF